jgi:hypothetical protein
MIIPWNYTQVNGGQPFDLTPAGKLAVDLSYPSSVALRRVDWRGHICLAKQADP